MAQYYVIRDKNTGLYFRGKGVNRWGKHYNQASIYRVKAMAENTVKEVSWRGEQAEIIPIQIVETAEDVVPKSEVDWHREAELNAQRIIELEAEKDALIKNYAECIKDYAREIFKRIHNKFDYFKRYREVNDIIDYFFTLVEEVENEYTEGNDNGCT